MAREKCGLLAGSTYCTFSRDPYLHVLESGMQPVRRRCECIIGVSRMEVRRTLHKEDLYPYYDQMVQHLEPGDHTQRVRFGNMYTSTLRLP